MKKQLLTIVMSFAAPLAAGAEAPAPVAGSEILFFPAPAPSSRGAWHQVLSTLRAPWRSTVRAEPAPTFLTSEELARLAPGTVFFHERMAAKIRSEEDSVKNRQAAVRYLGTVDCQFHPEVEAGLITGLRADRSELVRLEAAMALAKGCCCTPKVAAALYFVVIGSNADGHPGEGSERVREIARTALQVCRARGVEFTAADAPKVIPAVNSVEVPSSGVQAAAHDAHPATVSISNSQPAARVRALGLAPIGQVPGE
jgi:hypothetical protein